jgi:ectoine hydroxylase-related dioxygenase (phytanoyl-CoA dioxygenase family)
MLAANRISQMPSDLQYSDIVNLLARRYGLKSLLNIYEPDTALDHTDLDGTWFEAIDRLVYSCSGTIADGPYATYQTTSPYWRELADAIYTARDGNPCYDLLSLNPAERNPLDVADFRAVWNLLRPGGILTLYNCSRSAISSSAGRTVESLVDFASRTAGAEFYTIALGNGCAVLRKPPKGPTTRKPNILLLSWMIVREDELQRQTFLDEHADELLAVISIEDFILRERLDRTAIRRVEAARCLRPESRQGISATLDVDTNPPNPWLNARPWIDADDADIEGYLRGLDAQPSYDLKGKLRQWRDLGFATFENIVPKNLIEATLDDISEFLQNYRGYKIPIEIRGQQLESAETESFPEPETGIKINHLHCFSRAAALLPLVPQVCDFLTHIFQAPPATLQSLTFWRGSEQAIHVDYPYVRHQKKLAYLAAAWIPLEDIHPDAGPLGYYPGGHKTSVTGFFDWGGGSIVQYPDSQRSPTDFARYLADRMEEHGIRREEFCAKRGDVFIWHGNLPHEGTAVRDSNRTRKSYVTHFTSLPNLPDWRFMPLDRRKAHTIKANGGYCLVQPGYVGRRRLPSWKTSI